MTLKADRLCYLGRRLTLASPYFIKAKPSLSIRTTLNFVSGFMGSAWIVVPGHPAGPLLWDKLAFIVGLIGNLHGTVFLHFLTEHCGLAEGHLFTRISSSTTFFVNVILEFEFVNCFTRCHVHLFSGYKSRIMGVS